MDVTEFRKKQHKEVMDFRSALTKETDRGCALFAVAYLDKALSDLLFCAFAYDKKIETGLFGGTAPLANFSSRIKLAFYLGKISKAERRDLDILRKIRNDFAHKAEQIDFETPQISNRCGELYFSYHEKTHRARGHFTAACLGLLSSIHAETLKCQAPEIKEDTSLTELKEKQRTFVKSLMEND